MRILFALPGFHRVARGAEVALESVAEHIAQKKEHQVRLIGSGPVKSNRTYEYKGHPVISRDRFTRWPRVPFLRNEFAYEDLTFAHRLMFDRWRTEADITVTCSYPYTNWALRSWSPGRSRPAHVFVTQNGDWPAYERRREYRFFNCDGLVCTNPMYWVRNREQWFSTLIPNGVDPNKFRPGLGDRAHLGLPTDRKVVLIASALDPTKKVIEAIRAVARLPDVFCCIAGDGPLRAAVDRAGKELLGNRFLRRQFQHELMPLLYRSADVFLHMAPLESFGNVYIEALASGLPIVANDDEVTRWILGEHGHLIDTANEDIVADTVAQVLRAAKLNPESQAAYAASKYSWPYVAQQYCKFFGDVLARC
jgi:glycosyltransferase involved in cell wall biosynthesis